MLSLGPVVDKYWFADEARIIVDELQLPIYATRGTAEMLVELGIPCTAVEKGSGVGTSGLDVIGRGLVDFVINIPREYDQFGRPDGYLIRRHAVDLGVSLVTDLQLARAIVEALRWRKPADLDVIAWNDLVGRSMPSSQDYLGVPAVAHVDYSARIQTVHEDTESESVRSFR